MTPKNNPHCNGYRHPPDCRCGYGGVYYASTQSQMADGISPEGLLLSGWDSSDFCRRTSCPKCKCEVFFVRHNGGSVWFDSLGQPWPKHPCMDADGDIDWFEKPFPDSPEKGTRVVLGIIRTARVAEEGSTAHFTIDCADGTVIEEEFVFMTLNPNVAVGSLVKLELSASNKVVDRSFKLLEDLRAEEKARHGKRMSRKQRNTTSSSIVWRSPVTIGCGPGRIVLDPHFDISPIQRWTRETLEQLHRHASKVTIEITPSDVTLRKLRATLPVAEAQALLQGESLTLGFWAIYDSIADKRGLPPRETTGSPADE